MKKLYDDCIEQEDNTVREYIRELREQIPKWHLVADGDLPSEDDYLNSKLCWDEYRERCVFARFCNGTWILGDGKESIKVVAWMEVPRFEVSNDANSNNTNNKKDKDDFVIHIMNGYDTLQSPNGDTCFGCYINGEQEAYVAGNIPTDQLFHTIAHEYMHYLQDIEGRNSDEKEANDFGFSVFTPAYQQGRADAIDECINSIMQNNFKVDIENPYTTEIICICKNEMKRILLQLKEQTNDRR